MRKPMFRVVLAVLISLIVILGLYTSVLGASTHAGMKGGQLHVGAGLLPDVRHQLSSTSKLQSVVPLSSSFAGDHHCHDDDLQVDPND